MLRPRLVHWALGVGFALLVFHAAHSGADHDEIAYLHASWLVSLGLKPFQDFMEHHNPTLLYLLAPLAGAFTGSPRTLLFAARLLDLGCLAALLAAFVAVVRPLLNERQTAWTALLLLGCFFFLRNSMEVRPDPWMALLCFLGFWQWAAYLRGPGRLRSAALAGLCLGAAIAFLPKAVLFVACLAVGSALALRGRAAWGKAARGGLVALAAALLPLGALGLALVRLGLWKDFVFWTYTFNRFFYLQTHFPGPSAWGTLLESVGENPLLWVGGLWGTALAARSVWQGKAAPEVTMAAAVTLGVLGAMSQSRWPFSHNLLLVQPMLALLTAVALAQIGPARLRALAGAFLWLMVAKVYVLCFVYSESPGAEVVQRRLLAETEPSTPIAVPPPYNPIFRPNAFFFWFNAESFVRAYLDWCRLQGAPPSRVEEDRRAWREHPPKFVYVVSDEPSWTPFEFSLHRSAYLQTDLAGLWELASAPPQPRMPVPGEGRP
ncbi:MAG: hypothetical protein ACLPJH_01455 [Myxococcaceae bacterium]